MSDIIIDIAVLARLLNVVGGDPEDLQELIEDYMEIAPGLAADIRAGAAAGDWKAARIAAHSLKSNARDMGAIHLSNLCAALEQQCKEGNVASPEEAIAAIEEQEAVARQALATIKVEDVGRGA